jgi:hypothetical protein
MRAEPFDRLREHVDVLSDWMCPELVEGLSTAPFDKLRTAPVEGHNSTR